MRTIRIIFFAVLAIFFAGCTERIDLDTGPHERQVVIYGTINDMDLYQMISVEATSPYFEDEPTIGYHDAALSMKTSDGRSFSFKKNPYIKGLYNSVEQVDIVPGVTYTLNVEVDRMENGDIEAYQVSTTIPKEVKFEKIEVRPNTAAEFEFYTIHLYGNEPKGENYYVMEVVHNNARPSGYIGQLHVMDDSLIDGQYLDGVPVGGVYMSDKYKELFEGHPGFDQMTFFGPGDNIWLYIANVDKGYYDFVRQAQSERRGSNPFFGGPPSNIVSNIPGGVGYFTGYFWNVLDYYIPEVPDEYTGGNGPYGNSY